MSKEVIARSIKKARIACALLIGVVGAVALSTAPAKASDYYHMCRSVDGQYVMHDGDLKRAGPNGDGAGRSIRYTTRQTIELKKRAGYCIGSNSGRRHGFEARTYVKDISFRADGRNQDLTMLCELASDGLPAGSNCAREVVTANWSITPQRPQGNQPGREPGGDAGSGGGENAGTIWSHNGSVMRIAAEGAIRRIYYERPRSGLRQRGVRSGELLFEGERDGNRYFGTAYVFTRSCGKVGYEVAGTVQGGETRLVMTGNAPRLDSACARIGSKPDRLVFTLRR